MTQIKKLIEKVNVLRLKHDPTIGTNYIKIEKLICSYFNNKISIVKDSFSKPYIQDENGHLFPISISHSKEELFVVFSTYNSYHIGADYEAKPVSSHVIKRVSSAEEFEKIELSSISYNSVWMIKEAVAKAIGSGLSMGLKNIDIFSQNVDEFHVENVEYIVDNKKIIISILKNISGIL